MKMKNKIITTCLTAAGLLAIATFVSIEQKTFAQAPPDPAHAAHLAAASGQPAGQVGGQSVEEQLAEQRVRIEQLEAIIQQQSAQSAPGVMPMDAGNPRRVRTMPGMGSGAKPAQGMAGMNMTGGPAVADQMAELRAKMQRLEATVQQQTGSASAAYRANPSMGNPPSAGAMPMGGKSGMGPGKKPMQAGMAGMDSTSQPGAKPAMGGGAMPPSGGMPMMGDDKDEMAMMMSKMDNMMGMMGKMMGGMGGGAMPASGAPMAPAASGGMGGGGMGMGMMDKMMGGMGGGAMPAGAPAAGMSGGGMGMMAMDKMEMAGMMGMTGMGGGAGAAMPQSALPGFPGASHLYHLGATGFFLDHQQHIALSTQQKMMLNQAKEQAALDKASVNRSVQEAEQDLWMLTAADQPDNAQIEAKVGEIEKLKGDARLRFIAAIGEASKLLTDQQRQILTGFAPPAPAPAAAPMAGGMKDM